MSINHGKKVKALIVDDSAFMRMVISEILSSDEKISVIGTAKDGQEAIEKVKTLKPDIVTLDVEMPIMNGLQCLEEILKISCIPVIMLSSLTKAGAEATIKALELGAVDFVTKPTNIFDIKKDDKRKELLEKVKIQRSSIHKKKTIILNTEPETINNTVKRSSKIDNIVAIGTSTGGPKALQHVITNIPGDISASFLVVQHMPKGFTKSLADRLNSISELFVKEAEDGEIVKAGYVYLAPGDHHMKVITEKNKDIRIIIDQSPPAGGHRPSVNVMFNSLSETGLKNIIAVIMTGMGSDGSEGLRKIKGENNGYIIAQDEKTSVVYGMPKAAVNLGVADVVLPLDKIANEIINNVGVRK